MSFKKLFSSAIQWINYNLDDVKLNSNETITLPRTSIFDDILEDLINKCKLTQYEYFENIKIDQKNVSFRPLKFRTIYGNELIVVSKVFELDENDRMILHDVKSFDHFKNLPLWKNDDYSIEIMSQPTIICDQQRVSVIPEVIQIIFSHKLSPKHGHRQKSSGIKANTGSNNFDQVLIKWCNRYVLYCE